MNISFAVRYTAELFMIVPAAAMAIIPVRKYLRFSSIMTYSLLSVMISVYIVSGTVQLYARCFCCRQITFCFHLWFCF